MVRRRQSNRYGYMGYEDSESEEDPTTKPTCTECGESLVLFQNFL